MKPAVIEKAPEGWIKLEDGSWHCPNCGCVLGGISRSLGLCAVCGWEKERKE